MRTLWSQYDGRAASAYHEQHVLRRHRAGAEPHVSVWRIEQCPTLQGPDRGGPDAECQTSSSGTSDYKFHGQLKIIRPDHRLRHEEPRKCEESPDLMWRLAFYGLFCGGE